MVALGCLAPLFFLVLLVFGISSATMSTASQMAVPVLAGTPIVVTAVAETPQPTLQSREPQFVLEKPLKIVVDSEAGAGLVR